MGGGELGAHIPRGDRVDPHPMGGPLIRRAEVPGRRQLSSLCPAGARRPERPGSATGSARPRVLLTGWSRQRSSVGQLERDVGVAGLVERAPAGEVMAVQDPAGLGGVVAGGPAAVRTPSRSRCPGSGRRDAVAVLARLTGSGHRPDAVLVWQATWRSRRRDTGSHRVGRATTTAPGGPGRPRDRLSWSGATSGGT
jgi:hypothetical protein